MSDANSQSALGALIDEIASCPAGSQTANLEKWTSRFEASYQNEPDDWIKFLELLPLAASDPSRSASLDNFPDYLLAVDYQARARDSFLLQPSVVHHLSDRFWCSQLGSRALTYVAGCMNLGFVSMSVGPRSQEAETELASVLRNHYVLSLVAIALKHEYVLNIDAAGCRTPGGLQVIGSDPWQPPWDRSFEPEDVCSLVEEFGHERLFDMFRTLLRMQSLPRMVLASLVEAVADSLSRTECRRMLQAFSFESPRLSGALRKRYEQDSSLYSKREWLALWSRYLPVGDAFDFCWEVVRAPRDSRDSRPFEGGSEARREKLQDLLLLSEGRGELDGRIALPLATWRNSAVRLYSAIGSLTELRWGDAEEHSVRHDEAIAALNDSPELIPGAVEGVLDNCGEYWNAIDPIILGLPSERSVPVLQQYIDQARLPSDASYHARRLLAHATGQALSTTPDAGETGILSAAENLIRWTRTRSPIITARTWLGDIGIESLWYGALTAAHAEFDEDLASQFGQAEHEHCYHLACHLAHELNSTNAAVRAWLRGCHVAPAFVRVAVRRIPPRSRAGAAQEGGAGGLQADLGFLLNCNVPGKCVAQRITLMQAKKLPVPLPGSPWPAEFRLTQRERSQLSTLLQVSEQAHYLFILPRQLGPTLSVMPAMLARDILASRRQSGGVPVPTVLQTATRLADFILYHVIGLWTGDENHKLIARGAGGAEHYQAPRVMIDVAISQSSEVAPQ